MVSGALRTQSCRQFRLFKSQAKRHLPSQQYKLDFPLLERLLPVLLHLETLLQGFLRYSHLPRGFPLYSHLPRTPRRPVH